MLILGYISPTGTYTRYKNPLPANLTSIWFNKGKDQAKSSFNFSGWIEAWDYVGTKPADPYQRSAAKSAFIAGFYAERKGKSKSRVKSRKQRQSSLWQHIKTFGLRGFE